MKNTNANLKKTLHATIASVALMWIALLSSGYAIASQGTVIDKTTGKPMAGVFVVTTWSGYVAIAVQTRGVCYDTEMTTTDERGRFSISTFGKFQPFLQNKNRNIYVVATGYEADRSSEGLDYVMRPRQGTKSEQFTKANEYMRMGGGCGEPIPDSRVLPYLKAIYADLAALATTKDEIDIVDSVLWEIENLELGKKVADENRKKLNLEKYLRERDIKNISVEVNSAPVLPKDGLSEKLEAAKEKK